MLGGLEVDSIERLGKLSDVSTTAGIPRADESSPNDKQTLENSMIAPTPLRRDVVALA